MKLNILSCTYLSTLYPLLEKAMAPHSSTLAWKIPWTEDPGRLQSMGPLSRTRLSDFTLTFHFHALEKAMATHSSVLAWRIPGTGEPGGLPSMGSHRVRHDWSDLAAAAAAYPLQGNDCSWFFFLFLCKLFLFLHKFFISHFWEFFTCFRCKSFMR